MRLLQKRRSLLQILNPEIFLCLRRHFGTSWRLPKLSAYQICICSPCRLVIGSNTRGSPFVLALRPLRIVQIHPATLFRSAEIKATAEPRVPDGAAAFLHGPDPCYFRHDLGRAWGNIIKLIVRQNSTLPCFGRATLSVLRQGIPGLASVHLSPRSDAFFSRARRSSTI